MVLFVDSEEIVSGHRSFLYGPDSGLLSDIGEDGVDWSSLRYASVAGMLSDIGRVFRPSDRGTSETN